MTKAETATAGETPALVSHLAQAVDESISYANGVAKQLTVKNEFVILGLRFQIIKNVNTLLPYLETTSGCADAVTGDGSMVHVITIGQEPAVRACVFSGGTDQPMKLLLAAEATDATTALENLMEKTESMLESYLAFSPTAVYKRNKADSGVAIGNSYPAPNTFTSTIHSRAAQAFSTPVNPAINDLKGGLGGKAKTRVRNKSEGGFFDSVQVNNETFLETCGEVNTDGKDSGFLSSDGEIHPNRSFVKLFAALPVVEEDDCLFF